MASYAYDSMRATLEGMALPVSMQEDEFFKLLPVIWTNTSKSVNEQIGHDEQLWTIYRAMLLQTQSAVMDFQWLGKPELFVSSSDSEKKPDKLHYLLLLPAVALFLFSMVWHSMRGDFASFLLYTVSFVLLVIYIVLEVITVTKLSGQVRPMYAKQRVDIAKVKSSLEKIAGSVDANAEALYLLAVRLQEKSGDDQADGLKIASALFQLKYAGQPIPENAMTEARIYLAKHGVEAEDYTPARRALFQILPSPTGNTMTIRPALVQKTDRVKDGLNVKEERVLEMGVACVGAVAGKNGK